MKKIVYSIFSILFTLLIFNPIVVNANIICNDGTVSPSCGDCHKGCCSKHGGCSNNSSSIPSGNNNSNSSNSNNKPTVTEKSKSADTSIKKITIDDIDIPISDNMEYSTTEENVEILVVLSDEKAAVNYQKNPNLVIGENIIDIKVTAENGKIKEYKLYITREKILSDNKNIKVFIDSEEVKFNSFESDVIDIDNDVDKLDISYELEDSNATAEITGNESLKVGYNEIIVSVVAENGEKQDYTIVVNKEDEKIQQEDEKVEEVTEEVIEKNEELEETEESSGSAFVTICALGGLGYLAYRFVKK